ncbi:membrane transporter [Annulohypoxylon maeteangense]|uniref:membrane transporter n=1 Tax=Annulohypoxylon maeteangense TaxID=1927788 RepID=UPI002008832D|nr:membrane transporter [Annulohypoxylon maeteangense]KAI0889846.1 membrane transporter [Annulohypoxylon maeteangense]
MNIDIELAAGIAPGNNLGSDDIPSSPCSDSVDIEELGKCRPDIFANGWVEIGFCISVLGSVMVAEFLVSGFSVLLPVLIEDIGIDPNQRTWPVTVFSLVTGSLLLPFGRLTDMFGGFPVYLGGLVWLMLWTIVGGFNRNLPMVLVTRALQGIGAAAFLPAGTTLLGTTYRPGPRKNTVFSLYGGCAPLGFFSGIIVAGLTGEFVYWGWFFWIASMLLAVLCTLTFFCVPRERKRGDWSSMDWWGCLTSTCSFSLLIYAITDASHVAGNWASPRIFITYILGLIALAAFAYVEGWVATSPLLPFGLFTIKNIGPLFLALFFVCGSFSIYLFYTSFYIQTVLEVQPLLAAVWFAPMAAGGIIIALVGGITLHRLPGTMLLVLSGTGLVLCSFLFALIPENPNYWAWVFPAMVCSTIGIDIGFNVSSIFITTNVPKNQQGLAGACINGLSYLGISLFLGWADFAVASESNNGLGESYKVAFWLAAGCGAVVILLVLGFIRIGRARSDFTVEEKAQQQAPDPETEELMSDTTTDTSE